MDIEYKKKKNCLGKKQVVFLLLTVLSISLFFFSSDLYAGVGDDGINWTRVSNSSIEAIDLSGLGRAQPAFADINGDSFLDMFVGLWNGRILYFENSKTVDVNGNPVWIDPVYMKDSFTQETIRNGLTASLMFTDIDQDGDIDLFIGYEGHSKADGGTINPIGYILFYYNTGDSQTPKWRKRGFIKGYLSNESFDMISIPGFSAPFLVDIDGDGDKDLFSGSTGALSKYRNELINPIDPNRSFPLPVFITGGSWLYETENYKSINLVTSETRPFFMDKDGDGDYDLYIATKGTVSASIYYFENTGTLTNPIFNQTGKKVTDKDGLPLMEGLGDVSSIAIADIDSDGKLDMVIGTRTQGGDGKLIHYEDAGIIPPVSHPELILPSVVPNEGFIGDSYRFSVIYRHAGNIGPDTNGVTLIADQMPPIILTNKSGSIDYLNGVEFSITIPGTSFGLGLHEYHFEGICCNGDSAISDKGYFNIKSPGNTPPELVYPDEIGFDSDRGVKPNSGIMIRPFTYKVVYTDLDNDPPAFVKLFIDSDLTGVDMLLDTGSRDPTLYDGIYANGEQYYYTATLPELGFHTYRFGSSDGKVTISLPLSGTVESPYIFDMGPDFGDAPDPPHISIYAKVPPDPVGTGPRHIFFGYERLGHNATSEGETRNNNLDTYDDAVSITGIVAPDQTYNLNISIEASMLKELRYSASSLTMLYLNAWSDYNGDGQWSADEKIIGTGTVAGTVALNPADGTWNDNGTGLSNRFTFSIKAPPDINGCLTGSVAPCGAFYIRVRLDYGEDAGVVQNISGGLAGPVGDAQYGEVEDILISGGVIIPDFLDYSAEQGFDGLNGVNPATGNMGTQFTYKVVYYNEHDYPPKSVIVYIDGVPNNMLKDLDASTQDYLKDGNYINGEQYIFTIDTFQAGTHDYYFSVTDGFTDGRLPTGSGIRTGPVVIPDPPIAVTGEPSQISQTSATLAAIVNANGIDGEAWIEYNREDVFPATKLSTPHLVITGTSNFTLSEQISSLTKNTVYLFRAVADTTPNGGGITYGSPVRFTTIADSPVVTTNCPGGTPPDDCAINVSHHSAAISGTVNANGARTTVWFEYGTSLSLGLISNSQEINGSIDTPVEITITGLLPERTYYFRAAAQNNGGTNTGATFSFRTTKDLPVVITNPAADVTQNSATLSGSANPHDLPGQIWIELWKTGEQHVSSLPVDISGNLDNPISINTVDMLGGPPYFLDPNTLYNFQVKAQTIIGVAEGAILSFVTLPLLPDVQTGSAINIFQTTAALTGTVDDKGDEGEVWFEIEEDTGIFPPPFTVSFISDKISTANNAVSINITGLAPNTTYYFRTVAENRAGVREDDPQNAVSFTTLADPPLICESPLLASGICTQGSEVPAETLFHNRAAIVGSVNSNGVTGNVWFIYGTASGSYPFSSNPMVKLTGNGWENVSVPITGLISNTRYYYRMVASNNGGTTIGQEEMSFLTLPDPPEVITGQSSLISQKWATLKGRANPMGVNGSAWFEYWESANSGLVSTTDPVTIQGAFFNIVEIDTTQDLLPYTLYSYRIVASNAGGTTTGIPVEFRTLPERPEVINLQTLDSDPQLTYKAAPIMGEVNPKGVTARYRFEYAKGLFPTGSEFDNAPQIISTQEFILPAGSALAPVSTTITGLVHDQVYSYRIVASNDGGETKGDPPLSFTTKPLPPPPDVRFLTNDTDNYSLNKSDNNVAAIKGEARSITQGADAVVWFEYGILNNGIPSFDIKTSEKNLSAGDIFLLQSANISGLLPNTRYSFRIGARNDGGTSYPTAPGYIVFWAYPDLPVMVTTPADNIRTDTTSPVEYISIAALHGSINPREVNARVWFEYWGGSISELSPAVTLPVDIVNGNSPVLVDELITGLDKNTVYKFRIGGYNYREDGYISDIIYGSTLSFLTPEEKPIVFTDPVDSAAITSSEAILRGRANPRSVSGTAWFYYWIDGQTRRITSSISLQPDQLQNISIPLTGLSPETKYNYQIAAKNNNPDESIGSVMSFTTDPLPPPPLPDPPLVKIVLPDDQVSGITPFNAILAGRVLELNGATASIRFQYRIAGSVSGFINSDVQNINPGVSLPLQVKIGINGLTPDTTYKYKIVGQNIGGTTIYPPDGDPLTFTFTTDPLPDPPIVGIADPPFSSVDFNSAILNGVANPMGVPGEAWFEYGTDPTLTTFSTSSLQAIGGNTDNPVTIAISGLIAKTTYYFRIAAKNYNPTISKSGQPFPSFTTEIYPQPPQIKTIPAGAITHSSAVLKGEFTLIDPRDEGGQYWFVYGPTGGTQISTGKGSYNQNSTIVSIPISGLSPLTDYSFVFWAENPGGQAQGIPSELFTTLETPFPSVITGAADPVGQNDATIRGQINPKGITNTTYWFEYGTSPLYGSETAHLSVAGESFVDVSSQITGLSLNTEYHYRLAGENTRGIAYGNDAVFVSFPDMPDTTTSDVSDITYNSARFNGIARPKGDASGVAYFEYGEGSPANPSRLEITTPLQSVTSETDVSFNAVAELLPYTDYQFRTVVVNRSGRANGAIISFKTLPLPPIVNTGNARDVLQTTAAITGDANPNSVDGTAWFQLRTEGSQFADVLKNGSPFTITANMVNQIEIPLTGLIPNTIYFFRTVAENSGGKSYGNELSFTTLPELPQVETLSPVSVTYQSAVIKGNANPMGVVGEAWFEYGINSLTRVGEIFTISGSNPNPLSLPLSGLSDNTIYQYRIVGSNIAGTREGDILTFRTPYGPPIVTTGDTSNITQTEAALHGTVDTRGIEGEAWFEYGKTQSLGNESAHITMPAGSGTSITITLTGNLTANTTYYYRITARNDISFPDEGGLTSGNIKSFKTLPEPPVVTTNAAANINISSVTLNGSVNINRADGEAWFEYKEGNGTDWSAPIQQTDRRVLAPSFNGPIAIEVTGLKDMQDYHFRMAASNKGGTRRGNTMEFRTLNEFPTVQTDGAIPDGTTAALSALVNPNSNTTGRLWFIYGTQMDNLSFKSDIKDVSGFTEKTETIVIRDLFPNIDYYFKAIVENATGRAEGGIMSFRSGFASPDAVNNRAENITSNTATLISSANVHGATGLGVFKYWPTIEGKGGPNTREVDAAPRNILGFNNMTVSASVAGLDPLTNYSFTLFVNAFGGIIDIKTKTTEANPPLSFTTLPMPPGVSLLPVETGDIGAAIATLRANLILSPQIASGDVWFEYGKRVEGKPPVYPFKSTIETIIGDVPVPITVTVTGLAASTSYNYRAVAKNDGGTTVSENGYFTTVAMPPGVNTICVLSPVKCADSVTSTAAILKGRVNPMGQSGLYWFEYGAKPDNLIKTTTPEIISGSEYIDVETRITKLTPLTRYFFRVAASNSVGTTIDNKIYEFTTAPDQKPHLTEDIVTPNSGKTSTMFKFSVIYRDDENQAPEYVNVIIDTIAKPMSLDTDAPEELRDNIFTNGEMYYFRTMLSQANEHAYMFRASDGNNTTETIQKSFGPVKIDPLSLIRILLMFPFHSDNDGVMPNEGTINTTFTYRVIYTNFDKDFQYIGPTDIRAHIDGDLVGDRMIRDTSAPSNLQDGDYNNGEQYIFTTQAPLSPGNHSYYFTASDGVSSVDLPPNLTFDGPFVSGDSVSTLPGENIVVTPVTDLVTRLEVTFAKVKTSGMVVVTPTANPPLRPTGYRFYLNQFFDVSTTAQYEGDIKICFNYNDKGLANSENGLKLFHYNKDISGWEDITIPGYPNVGHNTLCGVTTNLSPAGPGAGEAPTAISLTDFKAVNRNGKNIIIWMTASEIDTEGYYILRSTSPTGPFKKVNSSLIIATGSTFSSSSYTFEDYNIEEGQNYYYRLQEVDFRGAAITYSTLAAIHAQTVSESVDHPERDYGQKRDTLSSPLISAQAQHESKTFTIIEDNNLDESYNNDHEKKNDNNLEPEIESFTAAVSKDRVVITWITSRVESGFNLLYSEEKDGIYRIVNEEILYMPEHGDILENNKYMVRFKYLHKSTGGFYKLEEITPLGIFITNRPIYVQSEKEIKEKEKASLSISLNGG
ncbi:MAG: hypothetical protein ACE5EA_02075 [Nitrospirota bacterium]